MTTSITAGDHGIVARQDLLAAGMSRRELDRAQDEGRLTRLTRSLFATPDAPDGVVTAVRARGALTCVSALRILGVWTLATDGPHHIRRTDKCRRAGAVAGTVECRSTLTHRRVPVDSLDAALMAVVVNHTRQDAIVALDCILHRRLRDRAYLENLFATAPADRLPLLRAASGLVESPMESLLRFALWSRRVRVRPQVTIPGIGRVDFLIGERLVVEVDSVEHHTDIAAFQKDRTRDRRAAELGYTPLRFTSWEIMHAMPRVVDTILRFVQRDAHRIAPRR